MDEGRLEMYENVRDEVQDVRFGVLAVSRGIIRLAFDVVAHFARNVGFLGNWGKLQRQAIS